jgi:hypothetical protein
MLREYKAVSRTHDPFSDFLRNSFYYHMYDASPGHAIYQRQRAPALCHSRSFLHIATANRDDLSERPDDERPPHSDVHFIVNGVHTWAHR